MDGLTVTTVTCNDCYIHNPDCQPVPMATRHRTNRSVSIRKEELRDAALAYLLEHGLAHVSLRPMAAQIGTSARILIFHFTSKEGLLQEVMEELHRRLQSSFLKISEASDPGIAPLKRFWLWATGRTNFRYLRLLYEAQIVAVQNPKEYRLYLKKASSDWQELVYRNLSDAVRSEAMADLCIAVFDGLFLELMTTGERTRLTRAIDRFISMAKQ